jgi:hypothetical protein
VGACASVQTRLSALTRVAELPEGSGVAASRRTPGRFWSHNDSGDPVLFALDGDGRVIGRLRIAGAVVEDWEALAVRSCPSGSSNANTPAWWARSQAPPSSCLRAKFSANASRTACRFVGHDQPND